jgi:meckelin
LVRRFFFREAFSGIEDEAIYLESDLFLGPSSLNSIGPEVNRNKKHVRFIQYFDVDINLRESDGSGSIFPPLISISYGELTEEDIKANRPLTCSFKVTYWMNQRSVERDVSISLAVLSCLGILLSMTRTWTWSKRAAKVGVDLVSLAKFAVIAIGIIANVLFTVNIVCTICWFIVYKKQDVVHTLLPTPSQEYSLWLYLLFAFPLKAIQVIHDLAIICVADVFFIDWEKPKSRALEWPHLAHIRTAQSKAAVQDQTSTESTDDKPEEAATKPRRNSIGKAIVKQPTSAASSVSVWRSLFVANEWLELFPHRRLCLELHLFLVIFVMKVWNLEELTKYDHINSVSAGDLRRHVPSSLSCRVALGCLVYVSLILIQVTYVVFFHERYVRDKRKDFIDFCSVSNISVFIWVHERFGYYIHGRSPNGRAEVNMKEMHELLKREEEDLCSRRGLLPNTDQQTFEMTLPVSMYDQYQRLRSVLTVLTTRQTTRVQNLGRFLNSREEDVEKRAPSYFTMTKFLSGFIDHTLKDFDYIVRDKTTMESILDAEFDERRDLGYFYNGQWSLNHALC